MPTVDDAPRRSRRHAARRGHQPRRAARDPRRRGLGQDPRAHPPHRVAGARGARSIPRHVLAVTFTRKAAGELRARLGRLGVRELGHRRHVPRHRARAAAAPRRRAAAARCPALLERKVRVLVPLLPGRGPRGRARSPPSSRPRSSGPRRGWCKPDGYERAVAAAGRTHAPSRRPRSPTSTATYEREKRKRGLVDFDDLISGCADVLERDAEFAAAQRWRFRHLFVDEFQDASAAQFRLLRAWLGDRSRPVRGRRPRPGDLRLRRRRRVVPRRLPAQFPPERFPDVGVVRLGSNYRSTPQVVAAASAVLGAARAPRRRCTRRGPTVPLPDVHRVRHRRRRSARRRPRAARRRERATCRGRAWRCSTASTRSRRCSRRRSRRAGVPFRVRGGGRFLDRPEVKVALDHAAEVRPRGARAARSPSTSPTSPPTPKTLAEERREHVDALVRLGHEYLEADGGRGSVDGFLEFLQTSLRGDDAGDGARRRGRAAHVPPGQGPRVRHRVRHRARAGPRADLPRQDLRGDGRGAAPALRRAEPGRARAAPELGAGAHGRRPHRPAQPEQLARPGRRRRAPGRRARPTGPTATRAGASPTPATASPGRAAAARGSRPPPTSPRPTRRCTTALVDWRLPAVACRERARLRHLPQHHARRHRHAPGPEHAARCSTFPASAR